MQGTNTSLQRLETAGYKVCVFNLPASLLGSRPATIELQAVELDADDPQTFVVSIRADEVDALERAAKVLADQVDYWPRHAA